MTPATELRAPTEPVCPRVAPYARRPDRAARPGPPSGRAGRLRPGARSGSHRPRRRRRRAGRVGVGNLDLKLESIDHWLSEVTKSLGDLGVWAKQIKRRPWRAVLTTSVPERPAELGCIAGRGGKTRLTLSVWPNAGSGTRPVQRPTRTVPPLRRAVLCGWRARTVSNPRGWSPGSGPDASDRPHLSSARAAPALTPLLPPAPDRTHPQRPTWLIHPGEIRPSPSGAGVPGVQPCALSRSSRPTAG
jgi:hypothetical protein